MMPCAYGHPGLVQNRRDVVRVHALAEKRDNSRLLRLARSRYEA